MPKESKQHERLDSTMSLGDHLEELRARLIMALLGLGAAVIICLVLGKPLIRVLERPYTWAMRPKAKSVLVPIPEDANSPSAFVYGKHMIFVLEMDGVQKPGTVRLQVSELADGNVPAGQGEERNVVVGKIDEPENGPSLQTLAPADGFITYMKIALIAAVVLSAPWVFHHIWMFVAAGLYPNEKKYVRMTVPFSAGLFIAGALFCLFVVAPLSMKFLIAFNRAFLGVESNFTFEKYVNFITIFMLAFGIAFQTPIAIYLLTRTGLVSTEALRGSRKYVVLATVVVAAIATPGGDPFSLIIMAVPLYLLFELGIILGRRAERRYAESTR